MGYNIIKEGAYMKKIILTLLLPLSVVIVGCNDSKSEAEEAIYIYDENVYDENGYNKYGYDVNGYDVEGYDINGYDVDGYDFNRDNAQGEPHPDKYGSLNRTEVTDANGVTGIVYGNAEPIYDMQQNAEIDSSASSNNEKSAYIASLQYAEILRMSAYSDAATSGDMKQMLWDSYDAWDYELNKIYGQLKEKLSSAEMEALRVEQRAWIKERDQNTDPDDIGYLTQVEVLNDYAKERTLYLVDLYFD